MAKRFFDIKRPGEKSPSPRIVKVLSGLPYIPLRKESANAPRGPNLKVPMVATAAVFLLVLVIFGFNIIKFKKYASDTAPAIYAEFKQGADSLLNFELADARQSFQKASSELEKLNSKSPIETLPAILDNLFQLSQSAIGISSTLEELRSNGLALLINKKGAFLIEHFKNLKDKVSRINKLSGSLSSQAEELGYRLNEEFLGINSKLSSAESFLTSLIAWLEAPKKQRLLVLFQNPSEIRPGGGFIGSYAVATLFQGNLLDLEVRDIYDPDGQLDLKVIPPQPLQGVTDKWGARDANWFFDFPTSAKKVSDFLEASKIYSERGIKFGGAVAVNVEVIKDILEVIGPIGLKEYGLAISAENFLPEVQREVEEGADKAKNDPKKILKVLTPLIFEKLSALNEEQKSELVLKLTRRFTWKDVMVYFKDSAIEEYLKDLGVAGDVVDLPENFSGEYLAVVNANVAGGKSDALISQTIKFEGKIDKLGNIKNNLMINRIHNGKNEKEWWYRSTNRNYLQVLVTPGSELSKITGGTKKTVKPIVNYKEKNFSVDATLKTLEKAGALAFGKTAFASWFEVPAGESKNLAVSYSNPKRINLAEGKFQFVFERQSGVNTDLEINLEAPEGYRWQDNQSRQFSYKGKDLPARLVINLKLIPA